MNKHWIIENGKVREASFAEWGAFFECAERTVALTTLGKYTVSTVFLGIDHRLLSHGPPILFETMVFCGHKKPDKDWNWKMVRYSSMVSARSGHADMVFQISSEHRRLKIAHELCKVGHIPDGKKARYAEIVAEIEKKQKDLPDFLK